MVVRCLGYREGSPKRNSVRRSGTRKGLRSFSWAGRGTSAVGWPSADEIVFLSDIGIQVYDIVGINARALPRFPRAYAGGIPCSAAWNAPDMEVLLSRLN